MFCVQNLGRLALLSVTCSLTLVLDVREDYLTVIGTLGKKYFKTISNKKETALNSSLEQNQSKVSVCQPRTREP